MSESRRIWRFVRYDTCDGATNMAIDEAILEAHLAGLVPPTLRLYGFSPPAITLGHTQAVPEGLPGRARVRGIDVVRRPSGGRAVLHLGDLTYSFVGTSVQGRDAAQIDGSRTVGSEDGTTGGASPHTGNSAYIGDHRHLHEGTVGAPQGSVGTGKRDRRAPAGVGAVASVPSAGLAAPSPLTGAEAGKARPEAFLSESVSASYKQICRGLELAFSSLGLSLELGAAHAPYRQLHDCFMATTGSDLHYKGTKIIGSAQLRRKWAVLQHGSILLNQEESAMAELLGAVRHSGSNPRHLNLFELLNRAPGWAELEEAMRAGFASAFDAEFAESSLTEWEQTMARRLRDRFLISRC